MLPLPTGATAIATRTLHLVDKKRAEIATEDAEDKRELMLQLWYPCQARKLPKRAKLAAYLPDFATLEAALGDNYRQNGKLLAALRVPARLNGAPRRGKRLPLVVFSPGLGTSRLFYSSQIMALAARGFLVAAFDPSYDVEGVVFPGRRLVRRVDAAESEVEGAAKAGEELRAGPRLRVWAKDLRFVLDYVLQLNRQSGPFKGRIDTQRIAFVGHCFGGRAVLLAASRDPRVRCVVVENAWPLAQDSLEGSLRAPVLFVQGEKTKEVVWLESHGAKAEDIETLRARLAERQRSFLKKLAVPVTRIEFAEQKHMDFTDLPMLGAWIAAGADAKGLRRSPRRDLVDAWIGDYLEACLLKRKKVRMALPPGPHPGFWLERLKPE